MPVEYRTGNLFDFEGNLAHGVNAVGVMGKGIAVEFKKRFPQMFEDYKKRCKEGNFLPGMIFPDHSVGLSFLTKPKWQIPTEPIELDSASVYRVNINYKVNERWIYNLCVKSHWRLPSETYMIWSALKNMVRHMEEHKLHEVALPTIGCGLGGLDWELQVKPIIEEIGSQTPCTLIVYLQAEATEKNESNIDPHDANPSK